MRTLLASASLDDVRWARASGLLDGVVTTPALLAATHPQQDDLAALRDLAAAVGVPVYAGVRAVSPEDMYRDARELARLGDQIVVQLPLLEDALPILHRLTAEGLRAAVTCAFTAAQAALAARAGAVAVLVSVAPMERHGYDAVHALADMRRVLDHAGPDCAIIATDVPSAATFSACAAAGVDACALDAAQWRGLLAHPLTDRAVDQYLSELARRPRERR